MLLPIRIYIYYYHSTVVNIVLVLCGLLYSLRNKFLNQFTILYRAILRRDSITHLLSKIQTVT